jgi:NADP-dependent 3-hydroxy acid dehydrogenase YdfG
VVDPSSLKGTTDNAVMTSGWTARYADLTGKAVIVVSESSVVVEVVRALASNGTLLAIVAPDRGVVDRAVAVAEELDAPVLGMTLDPASPEVWERVAPHIEQRLGPIDIAVVIATEATRRVVIAALVPDMAARRRGVIVEIGSVVVEREGPAGVRYRGIRGDANATPNDLASATLLCASDSVAAASLLVTLGQPPG